MPTETQHLEQRIAALQSDLNAQDQALDDAATENNERELSRRDWFEEAQRLEKENERLRTDVERQRRLKMLVAEKLQNALANCSVYRVQLAERDALLQQGLEMINRGIVSFDDQVEYRQKLAALSASAGPAKPCPGETQSQFAFVYEHPQTGERHIVTVTRDEVIEHMEEQLFEKLCECFCKCQPVGETNVVDCRCDEVGEQFELVKEEQARAALDKATEGASHE
ncbi:hypothetical protein ABCR88_11115 [Pseudomonas sp. W17]|uniref:Uncharacterized protein n=1 Tax=Pseudomonas sp. W17 TaxID=3144407 RepID=A0AAU7X114_9PSED